MIAFVAGLLLGVAIGWLCAFFLWPTGLYARMLLIFGARVSSKTDTSGASHG